MRVEGNDGTEGTEESPLVQNRETRRPRVPRRHRGVAGTGHRASASARTTTTRQGKVVGRRFIRGARRCIDSSSALRRRASASAVTMDEKCTRDPPALRLVAPRHSDSSRLTPAPSGVSRRCDGDDDAIVGVDVVGDDEAAVARVRDLGNRLDLRIDPQRLNEAGVVTPRCVPWRRRWRRSLGRAARHGRVSVLELGAGTARSASVSPRGSRVVARSSPTSNPSCRSCERTQTTPPASDDSPDSAVECEALAWAEEAEIPTPNAFVGDGDGDARSRGWDPVAGCEILYWEVGTSSTRTRGRRS